MSHWHSCSGLHDEGTRIMKLIGVLFGEEQTFPPALVEHINACGGGEIRAESVQVGAVKMAEWSRYDVILDRISQDVPFFHSVLRNAMLSGTRVVNNPFWTIDDDKFFSYALARRMAIPVPRTVVFPTKTHPVSYTHLRAHETGRNLVCRLLLEKK